MCSFVCSFTDFHVLTVVHSARTASNGMRAADFVRQLCTISDDEAWQQSLHIEPKNPDEAIESLLAANVR